ncbi:MAG: Gfo/Idh/MocA family oxidoreductase, partial [Planctomycetota bacterium]
MPVRFAGIGFAHGHLEQFLSQGVLRHDEAELAAIADDDPGRLEAARAAFDVEATNDVDAVLARDDLDAIALAPPNHQRPSLVAKALRAGKHVFCDKPLAITEIGLNRVRSALRRSGKQLYLDLPERFMEPFVLLHEALARGAIGRPVCILSSNPHELNPDSRPDWVWKPRQYGGLICDLLVHRVDLVRWLTGQEVVSAVSLVSSFGFMKRRPFEEAASALLVLKDDVHALLHTNWVAPPGRPAQGHVTVYGLKGTAFAAGYGGELVLTTSAGEERLRREAENCNYLMC